MIVKHKHDVKRDDSYLDMIEDINEDGSKKTKEKLWYNSTLARKEN